MTLILAAAALAGFCAAAAGGFAVGYRYAAGAPKRLLERAGRDAERSLTEAGDAIELAGRVCEAVAAAAVVTERQIAALIDRQRVLTDAMSRLAAAVKAPAASEDIPIQWSRETLDRETELPDRTAFNENVARLLAATAGAPRGGMVLISLDGIDRLRKRVGDAGVAAIRRSVARLLCRTGRENDLACRIDDGSFAVLLADADTAAALDQAAAIREEFRAHPFRGGSEGHELLVTASFGFSPALPGEEPRLLLDRVGACVARSRRWGRNRLHAYDPQSGRFSLVADRPVRIVAGVPA